MTNRILILLLSLVTSCCSYNVIPKEKVFYTTKVYDDISLPQMDNMNEYSKKLSDEFSNLNRELQLFYVEESHGASNTEISKLVYLDSGRFYVKDNKENIKILDKLKEDTVCYKLNKLRKKGFQTIGPISSSSSGGLAIQFYLKQKDSVILSYDILEIRLEDIDFPNQELLFLKMLINK